MQRRIVAGMLVAFMTWSTQAVAQPFPGSPGMGGAGPDADAGMLFPMIIRSVGLSGTQSKQVRAIMESHRTRFHELFEQLRQTQNALAEGLLATPLPDLDSKIVQITELRGQLMREGLGVAREVRALLTPEQLQRASDIGRKMLTLRAEMQALLGDPSTMPPPAMP